MAPSLIITTEPLHLQGAPFIDMALGPQALPQHGHWTFITFLRTHLPPDCKQASGHTGGSLPPSRSSSGTGERHSPVAGRPPRRCPPLGASSLFSPGHSSHRVRSRPSSGGGRPSAGSLVASTRASTTDMKPPALSMAPARHGLRVEGAVSSPWGRGNSGSNCRQGRNENEGTPCS